MTKSVVVLGLGLAFAGGVASSQGETLAGTVAGPEEIEALRTEIEQLRQQLKALTDVFSIDGKNARIEVDGTLTIESQRDLVIESKTDLKLDAPSMHLRATKKMDIDGALITEN